jgi:hypothetical protein
MSRPTALSYTTEYNPQNIFVMGTMFGLFLGGLIMYFSRTEEKIITNKDIIVTDSMGKEV